MPRIRHGRSVWAIPRPCLWLAPYLLCRYGGMAGWQDGMRRAIAGHPLELPFAVWGIWACGVLRHGNPGSSEWPTDKAQLGRWQPGLCARYCRDQRPPTGCSAAATIAATAATRFLRPPLSLRARLSHVMMLLRHGSLAKRRPSRQDAGLMPRPGAQRLGGAPSRAAKLGRRLRLSWRLPHPAIATTKCACPYRSKRAKAGRSPSSAPPPHPGGPQ